MPYVVQLEQGILGVSDEELYQELVELRNASGEDRHAETNTQTAITWGLKPRRPVEWIEYTRWCSKRLLRVKVTTEDCKTAEDCGVFLKGEVEKYDAYDYREGRQRRQRQQRRRDRPRSENTVRSGSESGSNGGEGSDGQTSDEASMVQKKQRQGRRVQEMREMMEEYPTRGRASGTSGEDGGIERIRVVERMRAGTSEEESEDSGGEDEEESEG